jgi:[ribosomal protein S5]-alanine N-acetyltransferase
MDRPAMTDILLAPPGQSDAERLLAFERENRAFFEARINARPADYYSQHGVARAIEAAIEDAAHDRAYQYLVKTRDGTIVGRVNLSAVKRAHFHSATLGYRIAESAGGKGYASMAVREVVKLAFAELGLKRIEADASVANPASCRVLLRNGFVQFGHSRRSFELGGVWYDRLHFERHADEHAGADPCDHSGNA